MYWEHIRIVLTNKYKPWLFTSVPPFHNYPKDKYASALIARSDAKKPPGDKSSFSAAAGLNYNLFSYVKKICLGKWPLRMTQFW